MLPKQKFREIVLQLLFSECEEEEIIDLLMKELKVTRGAVKTAFLRKEAIAQKLSEIDEKIKAIVKNYEFSRISKVELAIIRLGIYEIKEGEIPPKVAIAEAVRLCRKFGTKDSANFVNAILDAVYKGDQK